MNTKPKISFGSPLGTIPVPAALQAATQAAAKAFWISQVADEFTEGVDSLRPTYPNSLDWLPLDALEALDLKPISEDNHWVMTTGVASHVDRIWGPTLVWVLVNDGLYFKQGREKIVHRPGEFYLFDDGLPHEVSEIKTTNTEAVYLGWAVRLTRCSTTPKMKRRTAPRQLELVLS